MRRGPRLVARGFPARLAPANMEANHHHLHNLRDSPSQLPASYVKYHLPYFTPDEVERMCERQRGKMSMTQEEKHRQQACGFIEAVGSRIGLYVLLWHHLHELNDVHTSPRKTIATAQNLYHRFHLFFARKDYAYTVRPRVVFPSLS